MRSRHADKFNHDEAASGYDRDVDDETSPIRAGYGALLDWVASRAAPESTSTVLELGSGTGNLTLRLPACDRLLCVDVSKEMLQIAREKLAGVEHVEFRQADLLECFDALEERFDMLVSTYAIHHLEPEEKSLLFRTVAAALVPGGRALFGDLMFAHEAHRERYLAELRRAGEQDLAEEIADEFFWNLEQATGELERLGFRVRSERFSELSFGIVAHLQSESKRQG